MHIRHSILYRYSSLPTTASALALALALLLSSAFAQKGTTAQYKLGAGDTVTAYILGQELTTRAIGLPIAPDGTLSFQQANNIPIAGLTIPEARRALEKALQEFEPNVRVVLSPALIGSKAYTILGSVPGQGRYILTQRITLLEAIATAGGTNKTRSTPGEVDDQVNLKDSFVMRKGRKLSVDFEKLFIKGDTSQNVEIQHQDHIYIASNIGSEYYIFGRVGSPGMQRLTPNLGMLGALTKQGGMTPDAWKEKILVVRNSKTEPERIVVQLGDILRGKIPDVPVMKGDILYVHQTPWYYPERILDTSTRSFVRAISNSVVDRETRGSSRN